jgi:hypothetical protein
MDANENTIENAIDNSIEKVDNWKPKVLIIGAVIGALVGLGAAFLLAQNAEEEGKPPQISTGEGVKLGVLVMGLLRTVATLGESK